MSVQASSMQASSVLSSPEPSANHERAEVLFREAYDAGCAGTSRIFAWLMIAQWAFAIVVALLWSPYAWAGKVQTVNVHVPVAIVLGGLIASLPVYLAWKMPAAPVTRFVVAIAQVLFSALLIHLSGGRIETHFHVFGSLAFLSFYRDWRLPIVATVVVATDHLLRGIFWPESVYGIANPEWWRFLEHAFWVAFEDVILLLACLRSVAELRALSERQADSEGLARVDREKSAELERAMTELKGSHEALARSEKLAAVGQLAASVGHELRNPLGAVRNGLAYVSKRVLDPQLTAEALKSDARLPTFFQVMDKELSECTRIISDLLDFARERPLERRPCPLQPLVAEAIGVVPPRPGVRIKNEVPAQLPVPSLDKDQFRQVVMNLVQNAAEAIPAGREGEVVVRAQGGEGAPWRITVSDDGVGIPNDLVGKIFEPLFTTKTKGTGLGLAIVAGLIRRHDGTVSVESQPGKGTTFLITLPPPAIDKAA